MFPSINRSRVRKLWFSYNYHNYDCQNKRPVVSLPQKCNYILRSSSKKLMIAFFSPSNCLVRISKMITRHCLLGDKTRILVKCAGINHEHIFLCSKQKNNFTFLKTKVWQDFCCFVWLFGKNNPFLSLVRIALKSAFKHHHFFCLRFCNSARFNRLFVLSFRLKTCSENLFRNLLITPYSRAQYCLNNKQIAEIWRIPIFCDVFRWFWTVGGNIRPTFVPRLSKSV